MCTQVVSLLYYLSSGKIQIDKEGHKRHTGITTTKIEDQNRKYMNRYSNVKSIEISEKKIGEDNRC